MDSAETVHRFHFAFNAAFHYLFPQLTMGLALLLVIMKGLALRTGDEGWNRAARAWGKIFAINFVFGVVTGIPLEFLIGQLWSRFADVSGGVIGQTLALEGVFAFFLESTLVGIFVFGEKKVSPQGHFIVALLLLLGTWLSAFFIVTTNAFMQYPVGYEKAADGRLVLTSLSAVLTNPWMLWQLPHTILASVVTASFVVGGVGAWYLLVRRHEDVAKKLVKLSVVVGLSASVLVAFPTGDRSSALVAEHHPAAFAAMEGAFHTERGAPMVLVGQPDVERMRLDNPIEVPRVLSFLTHYRWDAEIRGLEEFPKEDWPQNIPLLYYAYHVMVGLGTIFIALYGLAALRLRKGALFQSRPLQWALLLAIPFPYIANILGWLTTELGRQPWAIHGVLRTKDAYSQNVSAGNATFTLIGFMGLYALLAVLFLFLVGKRIVAGPDAPLGLTPAPLDPGASGATGPAHAKEGA